MAEATLDDVIHRLKLNNRNTNRALRLNTKEQAEAFGSVMGVAVTSLAGAFDASISRLISTSALTVNDDVTNLFEEGNEQVAESVSSGDMFESPAYTVTLSEFDRMNETLYELRDISANGFDKLFNALAGDSLDEAERRRRQTMAGPESSTVSRDDKRGRGGLGGIGDLFSQFTQGLGGLGAGIGFGLGGLGVGLGAAAAGTGIGVGIGAAGLAGLLFAVNELDGAAVRENVNQILAIKKDVDGIGDVAVVAAALGGIGVGLAAFGAGSILASGGDMLAKFMNKGWAESIRDNVVTLLSIPEAVGGNLSMLFEGGAVALALGGLGVGIGLFGLGSAAAGAGDAISNFTSKDWAQNIKDNVLTLLSISDEAGGNLNMLVDGGAVALAMSGLAAGLAIFGASSTVVGLADGLVNFTNEGWAQNIKDNALTLLSLSEVPLGDTGRFVATMTGLSAGLVAFGVAGAASQAVTLFGTRGFASPIVDNVRELLEINELGDEGKANKFFFTMSKLAAGVGLFTVANAFDGLVGAGRKILTFFGLGSESPIASLTKLTDNVDDLEKVSTGLESITDALNKFSSIQFDVKDADFKGLIKNIQKAVPLVESLATGKSKLFGRDIPSLLDPSLRLDELVVAMGQLNVISSGASQLSEIDVRTVSASAEQIKMLQSQVIDNAASPTVVVAPSTQNNSTVNQSNTVVNEQSMSVFTTARADSYL